MKQILYRINDELFVMAGIVDSVDERPEAEIINIRYTEFGQKTCTGIYFRNQQERDDGKPLILYADRAKRLGLRENDAVITTVRFPGNSNVFANGYSIKREGVIPFRNDAGNGSIINGIVLSLKEGTATDGRPVTVFRLLAGNDRRNVPVYMNAFCEKNAFADITKALTPHGNLFVRAVFVCMNTEFIATDRRKEYMYRIVEYSRCGLSVKKEK